jgi:serine O-acetyltransferase
MLEERRPNWLNAVLIANRPGVVCVVAYRITNYLSQTGRRVLARAIDDLQHLYTGVEIHAGSRIGPGLGSNCTVLGGSTLTLNAGGIDPSQGRIVLGDYCTVGPGVRIIGAVTLGDGTQIKPNAVVFNSSPAVGGVLEGVPARRKSQVALERIRNWNPLKSRALSESEADAWKAASRSE